MKIYHIAIVLLIVVILINYRIEHYSYHYPGAPGRVNPSLFFDKTLRIDSTYPNKIE